MHVVIKSYFQGNLEDYTQNKNILAPNKCIGVELTPDKETFYSKVNFSYCFRKIKKFLGKNITLI